MNSDQQRQAIEATSNLIKAVHLVGGQYNTEEIRMPCGRVLIQRPGTSIWSVEPYYEVSLNPTYTPVALAAKIRKLLVRHDEFLLTNPKKASKFSTKQH